MKKILTQLKFFIGWPLSLIALFFIARLILSKRTTFLQIHTIHIPFFLVSVFLFLLFFFLRVLFWQKLLETKHMQFSFKQTAYSWGFAELKRYVPGGIWPILGRSTAYAGVEQKAIFAGILQEAEFLGVASLLLSLLSLTFLISFTPHAFAHFLWWLSLLAIIILALLFLFHTTFFSFLKKVPFLKHLLPQLPPTTMLYLLSLMTISLFIFGLANYFATATIFDLPLHHMLAIIGLFIFSFFLGYISFFAPMGLGVREGAVAIGLARYLTPAIAALAAIFSRVVQILSEFLFLLIAFCWVKIFENKFKKVEEFCIKHKYEIFVFISVGLYILYFTAASFLRYTNFYTGRFDLGNMDQTVWNTIHGRVFQLTNPDGTNIVSRLAFHADFILILLAPLYLIWQDPRMLLLIQTVAIGSGGFFVYLIAKDILKHKGIALAFTLSYLLYPALQYANLYDFHPVTLAVPLFLFAWYLLMKKRIYSATILLILAATVKEEAWLIVGLFGIYIAIFRKKYIFGALVTIFSFWFFYFLVATLIPHARGAEHFALAYYSDFGATPGTILKNIFLSPFKTISLVFGKSQLVFLWELLFPIGLLSLLGFPLLIFAGPDLGISLLSQNKQLHTIYYHYGAIPAPFLFLAAIYGFSFLQKRFPQIKGTSAVLLLLIPTFLSAYFFGPLPGAKDPNIDMFTKQLSYASSVDSFLTSIPKKYSVAATNNVGSHLSHRQKIYTIPTGLKDADIVVFLLTDEDAQPSLADQKKMADELNNDPAYIRLFSYQAFVVYKKKSVPTYYPKKSHTFLPFFKRN